MFHAVYSDVSHSSISPSLQRTLVSVPYIPCTPQKETGAYSQILLLNTILTQCKSSSQALGSASSSDFSKRSLSLNYFHFRELCSLLTL